MSVSEQAPTCEADRVHASVVTAPLSPRPRSHLHALSSHEGETSTQNNTQHNHTHSHSTHHFTGLPVHGLEHRPVGAVAQLLGDLVAIHPRVVLVVRSLVAPRGRSSTCAAAAAFSLARALVAAVVGARRFGTGARNKCPRPLQDSSFKNTSSLRNMGRPGCCVAANHLDQVVTISSEE